MSTISLFTPVDYSGASSCAERALSVLSHYFYLGGPRATVSENDKIHVEPGAVSWSTVALKVVSYVLLFPFTFALFAIYLGLRHQHHFTVISSPNQVTNQLQDMLSQHTIVPETRQPPTPPLPISQSLSASTFSITPVSPSHQPLPSPQPPQSLLSPPRISLYSSLSLQLSPCIECK